MSREIKVAEMFAGVGGFRLALDGYEDQRHPEFTMPAAGPFSTVWANQWEPNGRETKQFAWRCYEERFGSGSCINEDIAEVLEGVERGDREIPDFDMVVGGFPCQDYSVAKPLSRAGGIEGKKGVLWWQIYKMLRLKSPKYALFENVDRLLKSPAKQRGRDFAIILSCLAKLGYSVEWRVINAADYGMPQRRRRVYIYCVKTEKDWDLAQRLETSGVMARSFPVKDGFDRNTPTFKISKDPYRVSEGFGVGDRVSVFQNAGVMQDGQVLTVRVSAEYDGAHKTIADIMVPDEEVPASFFLPRAAEERWKYLKGAKREERTSSDGFAYVYSEGGVEFPDSVDKPARTILTGEGGSGPSRTKHVIRSQDGRLRRLVPDELDQLQMFPKGWTSSGMTDGHRAFCMGNALVVGIPHRIGRNIASDFATDAD